jgi:dipeptidyl-peptidase-4
MSVLRTPAPCAVQFQFMPYPNRTHGITEGEGTIQHKTTLMRNFLYQWCPPGGR